MNKLRNMEKEALSAWIREQPVGKHYYKCSIKGYGLFENDAEYWGHILDAKDLATAKRAFGRAVDKEIDGPLDYGFMEITEREISIDDEGRKIGRVVAQYVNDFGRWKKRERFLKDRFGITA